MAGKPGRPKRTEEVTSLLLRLPPVLLRKLDRCKAVLELREGGSLTRTSVFWRALDVGADVLMGEGEDDHWQTRMVPTRGGQPAEVPQSTHAPTETETVPEEIRAEAVQHKRQTAKSLVAPEFDPRTFKLGPLCKAGHDFSGGQSLLRITTNQCRDCEREKTKRQRPRKAAPMA